jgi:hypothetical protein
MGRPVRAADETHAAAAVRQVDNMTAPPRAYAGEYCLQRRYTPLASRRKTPATMGTLLWGQRLEDSVTKLSAPCSKL